MSFGRFRDDNNSNKSSSGTNSSDSSSRSAGDGREAYIGKGSKIVGTLRFAGPTELDGEVEGEVEAQDRLTVGEAAVVNARVNGTEITVKGTVNGDITASKRLILKKSARIAGSISTPLLSMEEGVVFEGKIAMTANLETVRERRSLEGVSGSESKTTQISRQGMQVLGSAN